jgi:hypothetical protein
LLIQDVDHIINFESKWIPILLGRGGNYDIYDYFNFVRFITYGRDKMKAYFDEQGIRNITKEQFKQCMSETM